MSYNLLIDLAYADPVREWLGPLLAGSLLILDEAHHAAGLKLSQAQRLKGLERETKLLRRLVADLSLASQQRKDQAGKNAW